MAGANLKLLSAARRHAKTQKTQIKSRTAPVKGSGKEAKVRAVGRGATTDANRSQPSTRGAGRRDSPAAKPTGKASANSENKKGAKPSFDDYADDSGADEHIKVDSQVLLEAIPAPTIDFKLTYLHGKQPSGEEAPLVEESTWKDLPTWVVLFCERNALCFFGHELVQAKAPRCSKCYTCGSSKIPRGSDVLWCETCGFWSLCAECAVLPRLHPLRLDPLFHGAEYPCLIDWSKETQSSIGTVIVCPGGNYEFLVPNEAQPVVAWLAENGIHSVVLRYRLLPLFGNDDALDDLEAAIDHLRKTRGGPVLAIGFSAGGHLIASLPIRQAAKASAESKRSKLLDGQVLVYAPIDGTDWLDPQLSGFINRDCLREAHTLLARQPALFGGPQFAAPPSLLVYSIWDKICPPQRHGDRYAMALTNAHVSYEYLRGDFGDHGFSIYGGWADEALYWMRSFGVGRF